MYIRDYLHDIPLRALKTIARALDVEVAYEARIKLINAIDRAFWDGTLVERLLGKFDPEHRFLLSLIAFAGDTGASETELFRGIDRMTGLNRTSAQPLIDDLLRVGLAGCIVDGENRYFCPRGVAEQLRSRFLREVVLRPDVTGYVPNSTFPNLLEDIFSLLALIYKENAPLTLTGFIKKPVLERALAGSPTCLGNDAIFDEEARNTFITEYLRSRELIVFEHRTAHTTGRLSGWLDLSMTERFQDIAAFAFTSLLADAYTIISVTSILAEKPAGTGFVPHRLAAFLAGSTLASGSEERLKEKLSILFHVLSQFGLFAVSDSTFIMTGTGERFFRNENLPFDDSISGDFLIQPNFEVIVGPELDPRVRFQLELLSDRKNRDMVLTYAVSREGISRGRERGMPVESILGFFRDHARNDVPQNVCFSIEAWAREYGSISFENVLLMRFRDAATCDSVAHLPELVPYLRERIGDTAISISSNNLDTIVELVRSAGYQPERYGGAPGDTARYGGKFIPATIPRLLESWKLPTGGFEFGFPEQADTGESAP